MLYLIALLEGFTTLAVQMIALRLATPIVGSSIILTSVFIGIILLALSAGYYVGGVVASKYKPAKLRILLAGFLLFSGVYYGCITFVTQEYLLERGLSMTSNYIFTLFFAALLLFFLPVFIDAQTIPLLTELLPESSKGKAAGSMLFASTIGSFLGSVGTSIWLFETIGVRHTGIVTCLILFFCAILLLRKAHRQWAWGVLVCSVFFGIYMRSVNQHALDRISGLLYHHDSAYQEILVRTIPRKTNGEQARIFHTNRSFASGILEKSKESPFDYLQEMMHLTDIIKPKRILVIGTAGFTYPYQLSKLDYVEQIDAVDIDPSIKKIAEDHFLEEKLSQKIVFIPQSARYVVNQAVKHGKKYDLILIDAYNGKTLPDELATKEFFAGLAELAPPEGVMANFILDSNLDSDLANNILTTRRIVFGAVWTKNVTKNPEKTFDNFIVTATKPTPLYSNFTTIGQIYTDNWRTTETDLVTMRRK